MNSKDDLNHESTREKISNVVTEAQENVIGIAGNTEKYK